MIDPIRNRLVGLETNRRNLTREIAHRQTDLLRLDEEYAYAMDKRLFNVAAVTKGEQKRLRSFIAGLEKAQEILGVTYE